MSRVCSERQGPSSFSRMPRYGRPRRRLSAERRGVAPVLLAVIVVVVAIVVVVGGLFAAGILKISGGGGGGGGGQSYNVAFTETGLLLGATWNVTFGGTTQSSSHSTITFSVVNGTYGYTVDNVGLYTPSPASGSVTVNGANVSESITFTRAATYTVTFTETGLGAGTTWTVTLNSVPQSASVATITFQEPNGSYTFSVLASGYQASPSTGSITVAGSAQSQAITFTRSTTTYSVTFTETGLGLGASWSVTFNGSSQSSSSTSIAFSGIQNGVYPFTVSASGYTASPASGSITVNGADSTQAISFTSSGGGGNAVLFSQASSAAVTAASSYQGGGWGPSFAIALAVTTGFTFPISNLTNSSESFCGPNSTMTWIGPEPSGIDIPATSTSSAAGTSAGWFVILSKTGTSVVWADVLSGSAKLLFSATGADCAYFSYISMSGMIDSSAAVNAANGAGGSTFLSANPNANREFFGIGGYTTFNVYPAWEISYTTCQPYSSGTGSYFNATVNGTSGAVLSHESGTESCGAAALHAPPPSFGPWVASGAVASPYWLLLAGLARIDL